MPTLHIPAPLRSFTRGETKVSAAGETLGEVFDHLEKAYPGIRERLVQGEKIAPGMAVFVNGDLVTSGLRTRVAEDAEIYFAPAIGGGNGVRSDLSTG